MPYASKEAHAKRNREYYAAYGKINYYAKKRAHMCTCCGKQDAYTLTGRCYCYECAERKREKYSKQTYERCKVEKNEKLREKYANQKAQGLCPRCGRKAASGKTCCERCLARLRKGPTYIPENICPCCRKNPIAEGRNQCERCYQTSVANIAKGRRRNEEWAKLNTAIFGGDNERE